MPTPAPNLPYSPQEQESLLNSLLTRLRGKVVTAVAGVFDRLNVSGDINARNLILSGAATPNRVLTNNHLRVFRNAALSTNNNATNIIPFDSILRDEMKAFSTSTGKWTCPVAGWYIVCARVSWAVAAGARVFCGIFVDGVEKQRGSDQGAGTGGIAGSMVSSAIFVAAGSVLEVRGFQNNGAATAIETGQAVAYLNLHYMSS